MLGMSVTDLVLIGAILVLALSGVRRNKRPGVQQTALILFGIALAHAFFDGARWQVAPAYVAIALVILTTLISRRWIRIVSVGLTLTLLAGSVLATWAFPLFTLPEPSGQYAVGVTKVFLTDQSRLEAYTEDKDDKRRLALQVWYPADSADSGEPSNYFRQPVVRSKAITTGGPLPWFMFTHLGNVKAHARSDAVIADGRFPVVVYSHGLGIGWSSGNTPLAEQLASQGYIVIAIGHPHIGSSVIFPDKVAVFDPATRQAMNTEPPAEVMEIYGTLKDISDPDEQLDVFMRSMRMMPTAIKGKVDVALQTQIEDQGFVLSALPSLASESVNFQPHIDVSKVGLFGMSIGGSASVITCDSNPTCGAVINLDGFHPDQATAELPVPSLSFHRTDNLLVNVNFNRAEADAYLLEVAGTTHFNYFDFALVSPLLKKMGVLGTIDGREGLKVQRDFIASFFDKYLKGLPAPLIEGKRRHQSSAVTLRKR